ncbi:T9SS type A sorting domain-containing protein, partial [Saprospiraceae bacterium]|nr:T9SS type A sorting domain-containing protein [Saprospiraceae bacterium]
LINKLQIYYVLASPYTTTSTNYEYSGPYLVAEEQEKNSGGNQTKYFKSLEYNNDNSLKSSVTYFLNGIDTTNRANVNYVHTDSGTETHSSYFSYNTNTYHYYEEYNSFVESPFYEKDSFINIIYLNDFETATESRFNSAQYSITGDSAFVRRENVIEDPQFSSFLQITKDVYIKYEGAPTEVIDEELKVATVFPCPASKGSTIIIHKMNADVDRVELYNLLGQKVDCIYLGDQAQTIAIAPQKAGNYYLIYFNDNQRIGQVEKLVIR